MTAILETKRLILRAWTLEDAEVLFEIVRDSEVMQHIGTGEPYQSVEDVRDFLERSERNQSENGFSRWAVIEKASGRLIGSCGFGRLVNGEIELGYLFARDAWGHGYATEAARASLRYGFNKLNFEKVVALCDPGHIASQHVLEKIGFICQGTMLYEGEESVLHVATNIRSEQPTS